MAVLLLMAVVALAYGVAGLLVIGGTVDRFRAAAGGASADQVDGTVALLRASAGVSAVASLLAAVVLAGLAIGVGGGRPGARVTVWAVSGIGAICGCCGLAFFVGQRSVPLQLGTRDQPNTELFGLIADAYPPWWIPLGGGLSIGQTLGYLVVAVLLALPAANAWFRRRSAPAAPPGPPPAPHQPVPILPTYS
ncbi:hypothetical protein ACFQZ8_16090 [Micromonospora azadirachtae]|uniref:Uncharacterized protein n=1 Tax=Micromonospora azadirachtae TaxID=1970735 RepID=A0ABW3A4B6_9ACTN